jgi:spermidine synthase
MRKAIIFAIIILGITSIVSQLIIIRESIISFFGNEFFIGWILFSWMFWTGIGGLVLSKLFLKKNVLKNLVSCLFFVSIFLVLEIILVRLSPVLVSGQAGEIPNLIPAMIYIFFILAPLCLFLGAQFSLASRAWHEFRQKDLSKIIGQAYFVETIGFVVGGLVFGYALITLNEFVIISGLALINAITAAFLIFKSNFKIITKISSLIIILLLCGILFFARNISQQTINLKFPNQKLIESKNSHYGNISITKINGQYNFYESGLFLASSNKTIFSELIHLPLLYHQSPKQILLIGGGYDGTIDEILKHAPEKIYYLEPDTELIRIVKKHLSDDLRQTLEDKRVEIINIDARYFVKITNENFDVIIINLPNPSTALINRLYTQEFFKEVKKHLNPDGILMTSLSLSPNYFGPETKNLDISLYGALKNNFLSVILLPENEHLFLASQKKLDYDPHLLIARLKQRGINNKFVNEEYIKYRLTNDRIKLAATYLEGGSAIKANQDQLPISYYYNLVYWTALFQQKMAGFLQTVSKINFNWLIIVLVLITIILIKSKKQSAKFTIPIAVGGFSLMAMEMTIVLGFQIFYGEIYYKLSLIIALLMAGLAIGNWIGAKRIGRYSIGSIMKIHALIAVFCLLVLASFYILFKSSPSPSFVVEIIFALSALASGIVMGLEFPIVNHLYLSRTKNAEHNVGIIYGADLIGACLGASSISIFFIPIFGIYQTLILLAVLNFLIVIYFTLSSSKT